MDMILITINLALTANLDLKDTCPIIAGISVEIIIQTTSYHIDNALIV
jgi:hypothetical protein